MITKKYYESFAGILHDQLIQAKTGGDPENIVWEIARQLSNVLKHDNPKFDQKRFFNAIQPNR